MAKVLCICEGGNVRSVAMAQHLKEIGHEAIAIGYKYTSEETRKILYKWADRIVFLKDYIPIDLWHNPRDMILKELVKQIWKYEEKHHLE